ncbi:MAG: sulfite exporter TauE/SafE family protein [Anaerorhabdus sp.]
MKQTTKIKIEGMTCIHCQNKIEKALKKTNGVQSAFVSYTNEEASVTYDTNKINLKELSALIKNLGYSVKKNDNFNASSFFKLVITLLLVAFLYFILEKLGILNLLSPSALADSSMSFSVLFAVGIVTSVHCLAMCGGINLSQCLPKDANESDKPLFLPSLLYNSGRVLSYTFVGFILGLVGWILGGGSSIGIPLLFQGILKIVAGLFMIIMGLNMLSLFPALRKFNLHVPRFLAKKINAEKFKTQSPFLVGLLNGLMPCGPLQSMQLVALASANPITGALSMFFFSVGTLPLMLGFGTLVSMLGKQFTKVMMYIGAILVVVLGLAMLTQGGSLSGLFTQNFVLQMVIILSLFALVSAIPALPKWVSAITLSLVIIAIILHSPFGSQSPTIPSEISINNGVQVVTSQLSSREYPAITVQANIPVQWIINVADEDLNGCNNRMYIDEYGIEHTFTVGENIIEFTPTEEGIYNYNCWMGMIRSTITVIK